MWTRFAHIILKNRIIFLIFITAITIFMAFKAQNVSLEYQYATLLPESDPYYIELQKFRKIFGEDANIMVLGIQDENFFELEKFNDWLALTDSLNMIKGVLGVTSISNAYNLIKDDKTKKFKFNPIVSNRITSQRELDSIKKIVKELSFYNGLLYNDTSNVFLMSITIDQVMMGTIKREEMMAKIEQTANNFGKKHKLKMRYSGLPFTRTKIAILIKSELLFFTIMAIIVTTIILYLFFRSFKIVFFAVMIVMISVIWSLGSLELFDYRITILTGMIPPLLIVIGIPNCVYLLNKYHLEYRTHGNMIKALQRVISKVGKATFLTNMTTAMGFATFIITNNRILVEFGIIASLNIMGVFILSILLIPIFFSFLSAPNKRHIKHLDYKYINKIIKKLLYVVLHQKKLIYTFIVLLIIFSSIGVSFMKNEGFIIDDIPHDDPIYVDLKFLENTIGGVLPFEISIDTKKAKGVLRYQTLKKINQFEKRLKKFTDLSKPISVINALKFSRQAYYNGASKYYSMPDKQELSFIMKYLPKLSGEKGLNLLNSFIDSNYQVARVSYRIKDVGTKKIQAVTDSVTKIANEIFSSKRYHVGVTGTSIIFNQGTSYLLKNLTTSLVLAILLISIFMAFMFRSFRMVIISLIPNLLPLIFTAGIMGYFDIAIKPSTVLVFSIAFGISVDNAIHLLAKYRQELSSTVDIETSVTNALKETGVSIIYTAIILFFGFSIFDASRFGGTQSLGILVSITLLIAMLANLLLLPSLLLSFRKKNTKNITKLNNS